jgi:hypothetical protein
LLRILAVLVAISAAVSVCPAQRADSQKKTADSTKKAAAGASLTGCVDEKEGHYVLVDDRNLETMANLEADGFPAEGFAKHVGQKVTVRGTSNSEGARPVFKVRSIEMVSETCAPVPQSDKK